MQKSSLCKIAAAAAQLEQIVRKKHAWTEKCLRHYIGHRQD